MPTPIGLAIGLPHPGGDFLETCQCSDDEIPVFVVSGRSLKDASDRPVLDPFGSDRSHMPQLGVAFVKIGEGLSPEELHSQTVESHRRKEAKVELTRMELSSQPIEFDGWRVKDNFVGHQDNEWVRAVKQQLDKSPQRNITIFVHGYNTTFINNTLLAAEIFHYLGRRGAMISFEWPSESRILGYVADTGNANYSTRSFRAMLSNIAKECDADTITIVGHSAGSPIVVNALRELRLLDFDLSAAEIQAKYGINRVVLAAPDMDSMAFVNAIQDKFHEVAGHVAVYASPDDRALRVSEKLSGSKRLGRSVGKLKDWEREILHQIPELEMIDASAAVNNYRSLTGHSYFHRDPWVSSDIGAFIMGKSPSERGLNRKSSDDVFWEFPKDFPDVLRRQANQLREMHKAESETLESVIEGPMIHPHNSFNSETAIDGTFDRIGDQ